MLEIKVNVFLGEKLIDPSKLNTISINNKSVNRFVNEIVDNKVSASNAETQTNY